MTSQPDRRGEIVSAVRSAMNQFGVRRLTVADVAAQAGISRQTVYEYFPNRESLIRAALEAGGWDLIALGEARSRDGADATARLATLLEVALDYFRDSALWSTPAKRAELSPHVTYGGGDFATAAAAALDGRLRAWWPDADPHRTGRAADTVVRALISHGLAPEDSPSRHIAEEIAGLAGASLSQGPAR